MKSPFRRGGIAMLLILTVLFHTFLLSVPVAAEESNAPDVTVTAAPTVSPQEPAQTATDTTPPTEEPATSTAPTVETDAPSAENTGSPAEPSAPSGEPIDPSVPTTDPSGEPIDPSGEITDPPADSDPAVADADASIFMSKLFFGTDGNQYRVENGQVRLPMGEGGKSISFAAATETVTYDTANNAIRFVVSNYSEATYFYIKFAYADEEGKREDTTRIRVNIAPYSARCTYIVRLDQVDRLTDIMLTLPGSSGGAVHSINLHAMEPVRVWTEEIEARGTVTACTYRAATKTVTVKGSVFHDVMIAAGEGTLGLFRLAPGQTVEELVNDPEILPAVTSSISIGFELQTAAVDVASRFARYAVLICMPDGTRIPLCEPRYATVAEEGGEELSRSDFKGVNTDMTAGAIDANVGSAIVDVYLNRLENEKQSGYLYTVENEYFYFNRTYLSELDATIRSLSGAACRVYLRFLVEADGAPIACSLPLDAASGEGAEQPSRYLSLSADGEEALRDLYAYTNFLCTRYAQTVSGIIVGTRTDESTHYNTAGERTLPEYIELYGQALSIISMVAKDVIPSLTMVVPVSDGWNIPVIGTDYRSGCFTAEMFVDSLAAYLDARGAGRFTVMVESGRNPYGLDNDYFDAPTTDEDGQPIETPRPTLTPATLESGYLSSENIVLLDTYLSQQANRYDAVSPSYFFHWTPGENTSGNALSASYVYHYYSLFTHSQAAAFFVSFREKEMGGNLAEFSKIKYLVKYIDTANGSPRTEFALDIFGADSWTQLIPGFSRTATEQMKLFEGVFGEPSASSVTGTYPLFDFTNAHSTRGWYAGNYCNSLSMATSAKYGRTLDAVMTADLTTLGEYSDIAYLFDTPLPLQHAPYLTLTVAVDCENDPDAVYEVKLVLGSADGYMEAKQVVKNGETVTVSLNAIQFAEVSEISYLRLSAKTVMGQDETFTVHLSGLMMDSREYDSDALQTMIRESQQRGTDGFDISHTNRKGLTLLIVAGSAALLCTLIVAIMLGHYQKNTPEPEEKRYERNRI